MTEQYRKLGYAGLVDRVRSDKGKSRFLAAHPAVRAYVENKYLGERLSIRLVYQALLRDLRSLERLGRYPFSGWGTENRKNWGFVREEF